MIRKVKKGFVTQRKWRKLFELLWQCHKVNRLLDQNFDKAVKDYQKNYKEITNMAFLEAVSGTVG